MSNTINDQPGPEFDITLAVKVMGFIPWLEQRGEYQYVVFQRPGEKEPYRSIQHWEKHIERYKRISRNEIDRIKQIVVRVPEYSTTWNGMQLVVEEMQRRGFKFMLIMTTDGKYKAVFYNGISKSHVYAESFETLAPHAVSNAAIIAISAIEGQADET